MPQDMVPDQVKLLKQFYEQFDPHCAQETPELWQTREQFNHLAEIFSPSPRLSDPLDALPPELALNCFLALPRERSDALDTLLIISKKWRYFIESASCLWNRVFIEDTERGNHRARRSIRLSRTTPLEVFIVLQPQLDIISLLKGESHRIREITLRHRAYDMESVSHEKLLETVFSSLNKLELPFLESLVYDSPFVSPLAIDEDILPIMPSIRRLIGVSIRPHHAIQHHEYLDQVSLELALPDIQVLAQACPKLKHLTLTGTPPNVAFDGSLSDFPLLQHFCFDRNTGLDEVSPLLYTKGVHLTVLELRLTWPQLLDAAYLGHLPNLATFKVNCMIYSSPMPLGRLTLPPLPNIREFHFIELGTLPHNELLSDEWLEDLFRALASSMSRTHLLTLSLIQKVPLETLIDCLSHLDALEKLDFTYNRLSIDGLVNQRALNSIKSLRLSNELFLFHVELPQVSELCIISISSQEPYQEFVNAAQPPVSSPGPIGRRTSNSTFSFELPSIRELTWNGSASIGILRKSSSFTTAFASLRRLVFGEPYARKDANDFCEVILRHPSKCPYLNTIAFHCYPSWDLLFYMLLRRNFMPGAATVPICNIELPGYPCPLLLSPLVRLLSRRLDFIPPLSDIALNTQNGMFDVTRCVSITKLPMCTYLLVLKAGLRLLSRLRAFVSARSR